MIAFQIGRWLAVVVERAEPFLVRPGDARVGEVDVDLRRPFAFAPADQERLDRQRQRAVARVPTAVLEEQILAILEPEQRQRREAAAVEVAAEQDREFVLHAAEFARHGQAGHDSRRRARPTRRARIRRSRWALLSSAAWLVIRWTAFSGLVGCALASSSARLVGSAVSRPRVRWRTWSKWRRIAAVTRGGAPRNRCRPCRNRHIGSWRRGRSRWRAANHKPMAAGRCHSRDQLGEPRRHVVRIALRAPIGLVAPAQEIMELQELDDSVPARAEQRVEARRVERHRLRGWRGNCRSAH